MIVAISESEARRARHPHDIFLINLITNHVLLFIGLLGLAKSYPWLMLLTPLISVVLLGYLLYRSRQVRHHESWFVSCHWQLCARHSRFFVVILALLAAVIGGLLLSVDGELAALRPGHYALGGVAFLPTMLSILALIVLESDAAHKARHGELPDWLAERYPSQGVNAATL